MSAKQTCTELIDELNDQTALAAASHDSPKDCKEDLLNKMIASINSSVDVNNDAKQLCRKVKGLLDSV